MTGQPGPSTETGRQAVELLAEVVSEHPGSEDRPAQRTMTGEVGDAIESGIPLVVQAGTGTGKSLAYLCGALASDKSVVVSTATRQLSDQLLSADVPAAVSAWKALGGRQLSPAVLKGRSNYLCLAKLDELDQLDKQAADRVDDAQLSLGIDTPVPTTPAPTGKVKRPASADLRALNELVQWAKGGPVTGERAEGPSVPDRIWQQVSTTSAACPSARKCARGEDCFAEHARYTARNSDVVIVNHALLAADLASPNPVLTHDVLVVDEVHELNDYLSSAWGAEVHGGTVERAALAGSRALAAMAGGETTAQKLASDAMAVVAGLKEVPEQRWEGDLPEFLAGPLASFSTNLAKAVKKFDEVLKASVGDQSAGTNLQLLRGQLTDLADAIATVTGTSQDYVRWTARERDVDVAVLRAAPLTVGESFAAAVGDRPVIATSATASVAGDFEPIAKVLGVAKGDWRGVDVGSPFDYQRQAILYIPEEFPEPVGRDRTDHSLAVLDELTALVDAAGGRTLALFTTTFAAQRAAQHLRKHFDGVVLEHGELPSADLVAEFSEDETSVLCATMGLWSGVDVAGAACSLVVIDKIPFAPMDDPLSAARRRNIDEAGGDGFTEVYVTEATLKLTQGVGRLVRSSADRGVAAILDPRLLKRRYGRAMISSLPPMWRTSDREVAVGALRRLRSK